MVISLYAVGVVLNALFFLAVEKRVKEKKFVWMVILLSWAGLFMVFWMAGQGEYESNIGFFILISCLVFHIGLLYYQAILYGNLVLLFIPLVYIGAYLKWVE